MQITLTVESIGFKNLSSTQSIGFESTRMSDIKLNPNSSINGNTYFVYEDVNGIAEVYTVTETVAYITGTSTSGTTEAFFSIHDGEADEIHLVNNAGNLEVTNAAEDTYVGVKADSFTGDLIGNVTGDVTGSINIADELFSISPITPATAYAGGGQANATSLAWYVFFNIVSTVASSGDSVKLRSGAAKNNTIFVRNSGANSMNLFPNVGGNINGAGVDTAVAIAANQTWIVQCTGTNTYNAYRFA